jgi:hypothetical protein
MMDATSGAGTANPPTMYWFGVLSRTILRYSIPSLKEENHVLKLKNHDLNLKKKPMF